MRIVLGVTGCIAAYKSALIVRDLKSRGIEVSVVMTTAATRFLTPLTLQTLSGRPVAVGALQDPGQTGVEHIDLARWGDLLLVAPATADILGKFAAGVADDFLSTLYTAVTCPVLVAPAMNVRMYLSAAVQDNLQVLQSRGVQVVGPGEGYLACGEEGWGRMAEPEKVVERARELLDTRETWKGLQVLVTAGPTREPIDAVRFLGNRSSGRMGYALADAAVRRGAHVTLISGPTALHPPADVEVVKVETAVEMAQAVDAHFEAADVVIKAAAVADFRVVDATASKQKKSKAGRTLTLEPNPDILQGLGARKGNRILVGFAAETGDLVAEARRKLQEKNADFVVANLVGREGTGFDSRTNEVTLVGPQGEEEALPRMSKRQVAEKVLDRVDRCLSLREEAAHE
jgi:phosphopantothenoylcysteine decarboxylase/phosphopantothenate--cysteine ligase